MNLTERASASMLITSLSVPGTKAPKAVLDAYANAQRVAEAAGLLGVARGSLAAAVTSAIENGRDPGTDREVQRISTLQAIANPGIAEEVTATAWGNFRDTAALNVDQVVQAWRKPFDAAAKTLTAARMRIGNVPLEDTATIMQKGGDIASVWAEASQASATIEQITAGWHSLADLTKAPSIDLKHRALRIADIGPERWSQLDYKGRKVSPWEIVGTGFPLTLATFAEYRARVRVIAQAEAERLEAIRRGARDASTGRYPDLARDMARLTP